MNQEQIIGIAFTAFVLFLILKLLTNKYGDDLQGKPMNISSEALIRRLHLRNDELNKKMENTNDPESIVSIIDKKQGIEIALQEINILSKQRQLFEEECG